MYEYHDVNFRGTIERLGYTTTNRQGNLQDKYANVYLPYGYDAADEKKKYNILYVMHGGGGNPDAWLDCCRIKNMLDYVIDVKEVEPLIVVFPSYYKEKISRIGKPDPEMERENVMFFQKELVEELLPAIEKDYHTYAQDTTTSGLKSSRMYRAFGGFSMGACTTWFAFMNHLDYFSTFVPMSGDCWAIECLGGKSKPAQTAQILHDVAVQSGFGTEDYLIFAATGTEDAANDALTPQIGSMKIHADTFIYEDDFSKGNLHYLLKEGQVHAYESVSQYLFNFLPYLFK